MNLIVPLLTKPTECKCESEMRLSTHVYRRNFFFNEGTLVTVVRVYDSPHEAELRCPETNRRWIVPKVIASVKHA
jgi:hypothetical protein